MLLVVPYVLLYFQNFAENKIAPRNSLFKLLLPLSKVLLSRAQMLSRTYFEARLMSIAQPLMTTHTTLSPAASAVAARHGGLLLMCPRTNQSVGDL